MDQGSPPRELAELLQAERWKHRVIVLSGPPNSSEIAAQRDAFRRQRLALEERQTIVIEQVADQMEIRLIGKDGGEKARWRRPVKPEEILKRIDSMPMRQAEMDRKGKKP